MNPLRITPRGILYLAPNARFDFLLNLPEAKDIGAKVNDAMRDIEKYNPQLAGVLPKTYNLFTSTLLKELLKRVSEIPATVDYDAFGRNDFLLVNQFSITGALSAASALCLQPSAMPRPGGRRVEEAR
jgi:type I restriction enzyme M protein